MEKIKVMIVEDMHVTAEDIASKLRKNGMEVSGMYETGEDAVASFQEHQPDLILMDIQLAGAYDGISTAKMITEKYAVPVIYLSDYVDKPTVQRATQTLPSAYLGKPFNEDELIRAIHIAFAQFKASGKTSNTKDHIFVKGEKGALVKLRYADIVYIEADRAYCKIVTEDKILMQSVSMNQVVDQIDHKDFVKVHRSYVINISKVTGLNGNIIRLGEREVEMSKSLRDDVLSRLNIL
jgi:DNA-binding LytR/AlgR family response regulator